MVVPGGGRTDDIDEKSLLLVLCETKKTEDVT